VAISASERAAVAYFDRDGVNPTQQFTAQEAAKALLNAGTSGSESRVFDVVSVGSYGQTLDMSAGSGATRIAALAIKGGAWQIVADTQKGSTGTKATTTTDEPKGLIIFSGNQTADGESSSAGKCSLGFSDGTNHRAEFFGGADNTTPAVTRSNRATNRVVQMASIASGPTATLDADATVAFNATDFTLNWQTADATARRFFALVVSDETTAPGPVTDLSVSVH
jgi:hypothetical protein